MSALLEPDAPSTVRDANYLETLFSREANGRMSDPKIDDPAAIEFLREIGERVASRREEIHMSPAQLATKMGFRTTARVNQIERGRGSLKNITALAEALEVEAHWLLHGLTKKETRLGQRMAQLAVDMKAVQDLLVAGQ